MDVKYINPFMSVIENVFRTMLNLEVTFGKPGVSTDINATYDVSGIIGLSGEVVGTVILSFPRQVACQVASSFAGIEITEDHEDFADAIGELTNIIAGNAKKDIEGLKVTISLPAVVIGRNHQIMNTKPTPRLVIPCSTAAGSFVVEVGIKTVKRLEAGAVAVSSKQESGVS